MVSIDYLMFELKILQTNTVDILQELNKAINFEKILKKNTLTLFTLWPTEVPYT